ncbi:hypothetical protein E2E30_04895 [Sphingomonas sp. AAP5]|uniref:hypothetical protein n=1 Tax=Sphingomonas sp. AAP5 TaxID=1523415 RepID=UPI001056E340|nr:hypothetical protein [Sphingomonas sp. AAP5]QBM75167.1 hypothetical protein E2E30_04895 [Sphingomonas sp. AAP5]
MTEPDVPRLSSAYLEDLAYIVLTADPRDTRFDLYPDLTDDVRSRLRSRLKQLARYDWPSSLREDPSLRRGYTLRQCCRLIVALLLIDTHLPPGLAIALIRNNESSFLRAIAARLAEPDRLEAGRKDLMAVLLPGEIRDALPANDPDQDARRVMYLIERERMADLWADRLASAGARLVIDVSTAAAAMWRWVSNRRLMDDIGRISLIRDIENASDEPGFMKVMETAIRKH